LEGFVWDWGALNWAAIAVAVVSLMVVSSVWYLKPVTGKWWMEDLGLTDEKVQANASWSMFAWPIGTGLVSAIAIALLLLNIGGGAAEGVAVGAVTGLGIAAMALIPHYIFGVQPKRLMVINAAQTAVTLTIMGLILGAWG
jgi:hypothetical protein